MLLAQLQGLMERCAPVFAQRRTFVRFLRIVVTWLALYGRKPLSRTAAAQGRIQQIPSTDYRVFSRAPWDIRDLFAQVFDTVIEQVPAQEALVLALDDTLVKKVGRSIAQSRWARDPLSPPFRVNFVRGLRFLHAAVCLRPSRPGPQAVRALSVAFELAPPARKPGKKATEAEQAQYRRDRAACTLATRAADLMARIRTRLDQQGEAHRTLRMVVDGSYTNRTVLRALPPRVHLVGRTRKDIRLVHPADPGTRKVYGDPAPTPEQVRLDEKRPYRTVSCFYGGKTRAVRFKEMGPVLWPGGGQRRPLRLLVLAPTPYLAPGHRRRRYYHQPAYLLTTDLDTPAKELIQSYLDRWSIEPLQRDLKTALGIGHPQVWSPKAVERLHAALVAAYTFLQLAALRAFGPSRTDAYPKLPVWRQKDLPQRPSAADLLAVLRNDLAALRPGDDPARNHPAAHRRWTLPPRETYAYT